MYLSPGIETKAFPLLIIDTKDWTVTATVPSSLKYDRDSGMIYTVTDNIDGKRCSVVVRYPVHDLAYYKAWAGEVLAGR